MAGMPVGTIAAVDAEPISKLGCSATDALPSVADMRAALEAKGISFKDTALEGADLNGLICLLYNSMDIMATSLAKLPGTDIMRHRIETGDSPPVRTRAYRHTPADKEENSRQTREMLEAGNVEESDTPWCSPVLLVSKKVGTERFCVDYCKLNGVTTLTSWPSSTMEEVLYSISAQKVVYWSSLDLRSGYWQTELDPEPADRTGFQTHEGNFSFKRTPFGLCGTVQFFQMVMPKVLRGLAPLRS
jgi:hypothetical protein